MITENQIAATCRRYPNKRHKMNSVALKYACEWFLDTKVIKETTETFYHTNFNKLYARDYFKVVGNLNSLTNIKKYFKDLRKNSDSPYSLEKYINFFIRFHKFLCDKGVFTGINWFVEYPKLSVVELPEVYKQNSIIDENSIKRIIDCFKDEPTWYFDLWLFLYYTGRRYSSIREIRKQDIDFETDTIFYRHDKALDGRPLTRVVFMGYGLVGQALRGILKRAIARSQNEYVFTTANGENLNKYTRDIKQVFKKHIYEKNDVSQSGVHILRRTSVTNQLNNKRKIEDVMLWSGFTSTKTISKFYDKRQLQQERTAPGCLLT